MREAGPRLDEIERLIELSRDPADIEVIRDLLRRFHGLAGSGTTYGFPEVTSLGLEGERSCSRLLSDGAPASAADRARLSRLLDALRGAFPAASPLAQPQGRILAVEDDPQQASFLRHVFDSAGYEFRVCADPRHFEADLANFRPDLVVVDIVLGIGGDDVARFLRQDERHSTLPVLFLTAEGQIDACIRAAQAAGDDHLIKPTSPALLLAAVAARIERARLLRVTTGSPGP